MSHHDNEERGLVNESTPMLEGSQMNSPHAQINSEWSLLGFLQFFGGGVFAPHPSTYDPIEILLNVESQQERDDLTVIWKDNKLGELNFVGVVSALLAGVLTSTGSWPNILPNGERSPWPVRTSWYCGIILALFSILSAADQTVRLRRLASHRDGLDYLRKLLAKTNGERNRSKKTGRITPSLLQIMAWQMPAMFLTAAAISMIIGMFLHVWSATTHLSSPQLWDDNTKVALAYTVVAVTTILVFLAGQIALHSPIRT